jgi:ferredoxin
MKRKIITIDQELCNGCGLCAQGCPEGAIKMIDGKAKLVGELYCDGLGACIGDCPVGAIAIEEREAPAYDEAKTLENIIPQGNNVVMAHLIHLKDHHQTEYLTQALDILRQKGINICMEEKATPHRHGTKGCPGSIAREVNHEKITVADETMLSRSELRQWPIQLHLVNPFASYFGGAEIVVAADCVPFSYPDFHNRFLKGKNLIICCPKLDHANDVYIEKLTAIFTNHMIKSVTVVHMEVPCCLGTMKIVEQAILNAEKAILTKEYNISIEGNII